MAFVAWYQYLFSSFWTWGGSVIFLMLILLIVMELKK